MGYVIYMGTHYCLFYIKQQNNIESSLVPDHLAHKKIWKLNDDIFRNTIINNGLPSTQLKAYRKILIYKWADSFAFLEAFPQTKLLRHFLTLRITMCILLYSGTQMKKMYTLNISSYSTIQWVKNLYLLGASDPVMGGHFFWMDLRWMF